MLPTFEAVTLGDSNDVDHLVLGEDVRDGHGLLQVLLSPVHLVSDASPVELHLRQVGLFLLYGQQSHLEMEKHLNLEKDFLIRKYFSN